MCCLADIHEVIAEVTPILQGSGNYFRTGRRTPLQPDRRVTCLNSYAVYDGSALVVTSTHARRFEVVRRLGAGGMGLAHEWKPCVRLSAHDLWEALVL